MPRPASLTPELLQTFLTIVQCDGDAMKAARILNINQPSISKRLSLLQHAGRILRRPWLERHGKTWFLTEEGKRVLPAVEAIVHRYRILTEAISPTNQPGWVLACNPNLLDNVVRHSLHRFCKQHSKDSYRITTPKNSICIEGIANGSFDMAIVSESDADIYTIAHRPLKIEVLADDPIMMVVSQNSGWSVYMKQFLANPTPERFYQLAFLLPSSDLSLRKHINHQLRLAEVSNELNVVIESSHWPTLLTYVRDEVGVALLPKSALVEGHLAELIVEPLPANYTFENQLKLVTRVRPVTEEIDLSPSGISFANLLRDEFSKRFSNKIG